MKMKVWPGIHPFTCKLTTEGIKDFKYKDNRESSSERGYDAQWHKVRNIYLRSNPLCEECLKGGIINKGTKDEPLMVHHIIPIKGKDDPNRLLMTNLMTLCVQCHATKHGNNLLGNVGGCDGSGLPTNKLHPWNQGR